MNKKEFVKKIKINKQTIIFITITWLLNMRSDFKSFILGIWIQQNEK